MGRNRIKDARRQRRRARAATLAKQQKKDGLNPDSKTAQEQWRLLERERQVRRRARASTRTKRGVLAGAAALVLLPFATQSGRDQMRTGYNAYKFAKSEYYKLQAQVAEYNRVYGKWGAPMDTRGD